ALRRAPAGEERPAAPRDEAARRRLGALPPAPPGAEDAGGEDGGLRASGPHPGGLTRGGRGYVLTFRRTRRLGSPPMRIRTALLLSVILGAGCGSPAPGPQEAAPSAPPIAAGRNR